ncbi:hypothetical protein UNPF46_19875 [Bradyrhizobium sp. UNPF46]|nr:hypothetical protein UNPF46_19875 [Bradyrhizobium sp. UNPF46]
MSFSGARTNMPETLAQAGPAAATAFESRAPISFARNACSAAAWASISVVALMAAQRPPATKLNTVDGTAGASRLSCTTTRTSTPPVRTQGAIM